MNILVIGSGGREHALAWKLSQSPRVTNVFVAPGNGGTSACAHNLDISVQDVDGLVAAAKEHQIAFTVVGPDDVLAAGLVDRFQREGLRVFGPTREASRFEWSKSFSKEFMQRHGIPTAGYGVFQNSEEARTFCRSARYPLVIKADGLALGKGVVIADTYEVAEQTIHQMMEALQFGDAGHTLVIEEFLEGIECSVHALVDGEHALLFPIAKDHKQIFDDNRGPNTGGMGTFSPPRLATPELEAEIRSKVLEPFLAGCKKEGIVYQGMLFPGLMLCADGLKVLEFNCRFGDPETQVLLPRLETDLLDLLEATVDGALPSAHPVWSQKKSVCVVMASEGYPGAYKKGLEISGLETGSSKQADEALIFHAGTRQESQGLLTSGGRVLGVSALGDDLETARQLAYARVASIAFEGMQFRRDIGAVG